MQKKGDISITTIIVAAIALIVLIVLVAIFTGKINLFGKGYEDQQNSALDSVCNAKGGICISGTTCPPETSKTVTAPPSGKWVDCTNTQICCTK